MGKTLLTVLGTKKGGGVGPELMAGKDQFGESVGYQKSNGMRTKVTNCITSGSPGDLHKRWGRGGGTDRHGGGWTQNVTWTNHLVYQIPTDDWKKEDRPKPLIHTSKKKAWRSRVN